MKRYVALNLRKLKALTEIVSQFDESVLIELYRQKAKIDPEFKAMLEAELGILLEQLHTAD